MKLIKGARTMRRYIVDGKPERNGQNWLTTLQHQLQSNAFVNPLNNQRADEQLGWVTAESLLQADFTQIDKWFLDPYMYAQFRVDIKSLPSNLFRAMFEMRIQEWLSVNNREKIPTREKSDIKDVLTTELLAQTLPRVKAVEFCWNVDQEYLILLNNSDTFNKKFIEHFYTTFGLTLRAQTPMMFLNSTDPNVEALTQCGLSGFRAKALPLEN
jgi:DNA recombination-dependent growth factor C